ncbi:MAG: T9SS type A sorting domain-containing protein [Bacteroidales bacterium]|nr:T9SS type A sorting domain-containing protein [Bacteroidales bacterium]
MKLFFTILLTILIGISQAQNFYFEPSPTIEKTIASIDMSDIRIDIIRSNNIDTLYLDYELITNTLPEQWYQAYCDNHGCWGSLPESGSMSPMYEDLHSYITLTINPNYIEGSGVVEYFIYEVGDYENGQLMTFIIHTAGFVWLNEVTSLDIECYPNPIEEKLILHSNENIQNVNIFTLTGQTIYRSPPLNSTSLEINAQSWQRGIYFMEINTLSGLREVRRIVKK